MRPIVGNVHDRMLTLLREMDFHRWLSGKGDNEFAGFDEVESRSGWWRRSRFLRAFFQFSKRAVSEAAKFGRGGFEVLGVAGAWDALICSN